MATSVVVGAPPLHLGNMVELIDDELERCEAKLKGAVAHYVKAGELLYKGFSPRADYCQADYFRDVQAKAFDKFMSKGRWSESTIKRLFRWGEACVTGGLKKKRKFLACHSLTEGDRLLSPSPAAPRKPRKKKESDPRIEKAADEFRAVIARAEKGTTDEGVRNQEPTHPELQGSKAKPAECASCVALRAQVRSLQRKKDDRVSLPKPAQGFRYMQVSIATIRQKEKEGRFHWLIQAGEPPKEVPAGFHGTAEEFFEFIHGKAD